MPNRRATHKGQFFMKSQALIKQNSDGDYVPFWGRLIPSNMIVNKIDINFRMHSETDVSVDTLHGLQYAIDGYILNIPPTSSLTSTAGGGTSVSHIDVGDDLTTVFRELGVKPGPYSPFMAESSDSQVSLRNGVFPHPFYRDRRWFSRNKDLNFPSEAMMVETDAFRFHDSFSTSASGKIAAAARNTDYRQPRMLSLWFTADTTKTSNSTDQNSQSLFGATANDADIDIQEWNRQAQTMFDPNFVNQSSADGTTLYNDYLDPIGSIDESIMVSSDAYKAEADTDNKTWAVHEWLKRGYANSTDSDLDEGPILSLLAIADITMQCQMYTPADRHTVTTP